jgi:hypothetical protein
VAKRRRGREFFMYFQTGRSRPVLKMAAWSGKGLANAPTFFLKSRSTDLAPAAEMIVLACFLIFSPLAFHFAMNREIEILMNTQDYLDCPC